MKILLIPVCLLVSSFAFADAPMCPDITSMRSAKLDSNITEDGQYIAYSRSLQPLGTPNKWIVAVSSEGGNSLGKARKALAKINAMLDGYAMEASDDEVGEMWICYYYDDNAATKAVALTKRCGNEVCNFNFLAPNFSLNHFRH